MDRRRFLTIGLGGGAWFAALCALYSKFGPDNSPHRIHVEKYLQFGDRAALEAITSNEDFYITTKGFPPRIDMGRWRLSVDGLVEKPFSLTLEDVKALPIIERTLTLECISNRVGGPWIGNARWRGTALRPLLERAQPRPEAASALLHAADGLFTGIPLDRLLAEDNFLTYEMNGEPLPVNHGYPLRVFIPGKYGMKQPKWITRIEFTAKHQLGYWERRGWSDTAERQIQAVIDFPETRARLPYPSARGAGHARSDRGSVDNRILLAGYAIADAFGIRRVELSEDDGQTWHPAEIVSNPSPYVWTFWKYDWRPSAPGKYTLQARAVNGRGELQPQEEVDPDPEGATGYYRIQVEVIPAKES